jgi:hypothetical protein
MPYPYQVWLRQPCPDYLATLKIPGRTRLIAWIESLGHDISRQGDYHVRGTEGLAGRFPYSAPMQSSGGSIIQPVKSKSS